MNKTKIDYRKELLDDLGFLLDKYVEHLSHSDVLVCLQTYQFNIFYQDMKMAENGGNNV